MRIAIYGSGSVGGYFGGRLAQGGEDVVFIARGIHLEALRTHGLTVDSIKGNFVLPGVEATEDLSKVKPVDCVLVCVKAWQVAEVATVLRSVLGPEAFVVPLENGVEAPQQLAEKLGPQRVLGGLCRIASQLIAPGHVRHVGIEPYVAFGELDGHSSRRTETLRQAFERAGVMAEVPANIQAAMWQKFIFIAAISGVGAVARAPIGRLRSLAGTRQMLSDAMRETFLVAQACGVLLPEDIVAKTMAFVDTLPEATTASMQRDIIEGRPSELEAQSGAIVRLGQSHGVPTPTHSFIYHSLLPQELLTRQ